MDEGLSRSEEVVRPLLSGSGIGARDLRCGVGYGAPSPPGSDENRNRLRDREVDGPLRGGPELFRQDSVNNNEEMDNRPCPPNLDTQHEESSAASTQHRADSDIPGGCPSVCSLTGSPTPVGAKEGSALQSTSAPDSSSPVVFFRELQEDGDHPRLPQRLHQIAEVYFLEEDYERALQFIQLERLYHERLLSNLTALQEQWESRWNAGRLAGSQPQRQAHTDLRAAQLETLSRICRTHQRPSLSVEKCAAVDRELKSRTQSGGDAAVGTSLPCGAHSGTESGQPMEEQQASEEAHPPQSEDASTPAHQRAPTHGSDSSTPLVDTPASPGPGDHGSADSAGEGGNGDARKEPGGDDRLTDDGSLLARPVLTLPLGVDPQTEDAEQVGAEPVTIGPSDDRGDGPDMGQVSAAGEDLGLLQADGLEVGDGEGEEEEEEEEKEDIPEEDFDDEFGDETVVTGMAVPSLDEMARRIKVEQTAPTPGLVSILKRKTSLEGSPPEPPATPKQVPKRKVRFSEPEDMADPDDVGLDSCLLLLLLCMVTMVISVGGTALYCTLGDPQSSVCTDFTHNVDFYLGQVQRGVDEIRHWLSPGS